MHVNSFMSQKCKQYVNEGKQIKKQANTCTFIQNTKHNSFIYYVSMTNPI